MMKLKNKEKGFSLIELMIVIVIITIAAAFAGWAWSGQRGNQRIAIDEIVKVLEERKTSAARLLDSAHEGNRNLDPVSIDFTDNQTTAPLRIEGADANGDGVDDDNGRRLTRWNQAAKKWDYAYEGEPLKLPDGWTIVLNPEELKMPEIRDAVLATNLAFDEERRPASRPREAIEVIEPTAARSAADAGLGGGVDVPFWCVYLRDAKSDDIGFAIAIHNSGQLELWRYDFDAKTWSGYGGRQ